MSRRGGFLAILVLAVSLPVSAEASQPCTEEVLATAAQPARAAAPETVLISEMDFSIVACWGCGATNPLPLLLWGLLFSATIAVRRLVCGPDRMVVLRLTVP